MLLSALAALLPIQDPPPDAVLLKRFEVACRALLQPMQFGIVKTLLYEESGSVARGDARTLFTDKGLIAWPNPSDAVRALSRAPTDASSMCAPVVMSAPPWHYEEILDESGRFTKVTLLSDGEIDVTKVQGSRGSQCSVAWSQPTERLCVGHLASPIPSSTHFVAEWLAKWHWTVLDGAGTDVMTLGARRESNANSYLVRMSADGLPRTVAMVSSDRSSGFLAYYDYSTDVDKPVWWSSVLRFTWNENALTVHSYAISDHSLLERGELVGTCVFVGVGDLICDGRNRPYTIIPVTPDLRDLPVPHVRILPAAADPKRGEAK